MIKSIFCPHVAESAQLLLFVNACNGGVIIQLYTVHSTMAFRNLTPHPIQFYVEEQFVKLALENTVLVADGVAKNPLLALASEGSARIEVTTVEGPPIQGIPTVKSIYGALVGIPEDISEFDTLIVSLPTLTMAKASCSPFAHQMYSPHRVVRLRSNTSAVLGAMGLSQA